MGVDIKFINSVTTRKRLKMHSAPKRKRKDNIKVYIKETGWEDVDWNHASR